MTRNSEMLAFTHMWIQEKCILIINIFQHFALQVKTPDGLISEKYAMETLIAIQDLKSTHICQA